MIFSTCENVGDILENLKQRLQRFSVRGRSGASELNRPVQKIQINQNDFWIKNSISGSCQGRPLRGSILNPVVLTNLGLIRLEK